jgi:DUF1680 family protein
MTHNLMQITQAVFQKASHAAIVAVLLVGVGLAADAAAAEEQNGYAKISGSQVITDAVPVLARPLPLSDVRLTGGPLKHAQELDAAYLLSLEPDRMLFYLRQRAGLAPKASEGYGGWDAGGRQLTGHVAGHYLSAVSYMYAATGDPRFKARADYLVRELAHIQDKQGDGYIGALMADSRQNGKVTLVDGKQRFADLARGTIASGGFDLNGMWSPWYVEHKLFAGLRDAYRLTGNRAALAVEIKFAAWAAGLLSQLTETQIQKMLATEFGGMNEVMADLYADTGDPRWLKACDYFEHHAIVDPLARHRDILAGQHGNTQVPKLLGELKRYLYTGNETSGSAARFFWDEVALHHSFATGGHGKDEYFGEPDKLNNRVDGRTDESCNVYNMLKMSRLLFALQPDAKFAEFEERALFNHVLGSMDPEDGRTCYMVPVGRGVTHEYQDMQRDFTCCVGTGMESHALHGDGIYYEAKDKLWVNFYTPSVAEYRTKEARIEVQTDFPEGESATVKVTLKLKEQFTLALRRPSWAGTGFSVQINGRSVGELPAAGAYVELKRTWKNGDTVALTLPKRLHAEPLPDNPRRVALLWGPLVLAGDLGPEEASGVREPEPVFVAADQPVEGWLKPVAGKPGSFHSDNVGRERDVDFVPFYRMHRRMYAAYWDLFTPAEWAQKAAELAAEREQHHKLELATVAFAQPGEMQPERDFNQQGEDSEPDRVLGRPGRRGRNWFSFDLPVEAAHPMALVVTYCNDEWRKRTFEILADGQHLAEQVVEKDGTPPHFFDAEYVLPADVLKGKQKITIRFQATNHSEIAGVFGLRMIRADAGR